MNTSDWIGIYGAILSTLIAIAAVFRWTISWRKRETEKKKLGTELYLLNKIDINTKKKHPVVVIMLANLGSERISIKGIEYSGSKSGMPSKGSPGWYEEPEARYGIQKRLLPVVLESGQTKDLPILSIGIFSHNDDLKIWLNTFDDEKVFLDESDILKMKDEVLKC